jgi:hypothetical protein
MTPQPDRHVARCVIVTCPTCGWQMSEGLLPYHQQRQHPPKAPRKGADGQ